MLLVLVHTVTRLIIKFKIAMSTKACYDFDFDRPKETVNIY